MNTLGRHDDLVRAICKRDSSVRTTGFSHAVLEALSCDAPDLCADEIEDEVHMTGFRRRPDAYLIDQKRQTIIMWEVIVTNEVSDEKLADYACLWEGLDGWGWWLGLVCMDLTGHEAEVSLCDHWYKLLLERVAYETDT